MHTITIYIVHVNVAVFTNFVLPSFQIGVMHTTVGILDPPLGNTRLQVVRLMSAVLQCSSTSIANEVIRLKTFTNLLVSVPLSLLLPLLVLPCIFLLPIFSPVPNFHINLIELSVYHTVSLALISLPSHPYYFWCPLLGIDCPPPPKKKKKSL